VTDETIVIRHPLYDVTAHALKIYVRPIMGLFFLAATNCTSAAVQLKRTGPIYFVLLPFYPVFTM